jgi:hypothetical protein
MIDSVERLRCDGRVRLTKVAARDAVKDGDVKARRCGACGWWHVWPR